MSTADRYVGRRTVCSAQNERSHPNAVALMHCPRVKIVQTLVEGTEGPDRRHEKKSIPSAIVNGFTAKLRRPREKV